MKRSETMAVVRDYIRSHGQQEGYPTVLVMTDGEVMCHLCVKDNYRLISMATRANDRDGWAAFGVDAYWEGPAINCCHCGGEIESAYGDPEEN